uniref:Uncharacterized protein ycf35 n=1 Tax=Symphyocladiella dendroidea TaxID=2506487 RepID=A0A1Z1M7J0_9FLOR|nr:hypothetical protein [Symphyocladiella dendroidea]ARW61801.1 hypothetical protein [Symphyocladiella dendroidea]
MSHFSKIKTNITNLNTLVKTITQLGFNYRFFSNTENYIHNNQEVKKNDILVYQLNEYSKENHVFTFIWNINEYNLVVDLELWSLDIDFNYLIDRLFQQYAYNMVVDTSSISGFYKIKDNINYDGSIKLTLQRWNNS